MSSAFHAIAIEDTNGDYKEKLIKADRDCYYWSDDPDDSDILKHKIGNGATIVQLNQPYIVDSMRLFLLDHDDRSYSYYIEVSTDRVHWNMIVDKRNEYCRSRQTLTFPKQPVVFIRIVGTYSSANDDFDCVYLECPSQKTVLKK